MTAATERARMQLTQALTRADSPAAREHIRAALDELDAPDRLIECRTCGRVGLPERLICTHCAED